MSVDKESIADTAGAIPEGWKLVPIMPTLEMQYAAIDTGCCTRPIDAYAAMLEIAPPAPSVADAGASDKPMTDAQIAAGWRQTFSTDNPYCPCNLKSFTKAVRWAERAKESK